MEAVHEAGRGRHALADAALKLTNEPLDDGDSPGGHPFQRRKRGRPGSSSSSVPVLPPSTDASESIVSFCATTSAPSVPAMVVGSPWLIPLTQD